jgi:drug/metabolite transporter (DMT)-like permease
VIALLFGIGAALLWGVGAAVGGRVARTLGARTSILLGTGVGMVVILPAALLSGPAPSRPRDWLMAGAAGALYVVGITCWTRGVTRASIGLVTTMVSTDGAVAAVIAIVLGESVSPGAGVALGVVVLGIMLSTRSGSSEHEAISPTAIVYGLAGAAAFGAVFVVGAHVGTAGALWVTTIGRGVAVVLVLPLVRDARWPTRRVWPLVVFSAASDVGGFTLYILGSHHGIAIASVLTSQYALVAVIAGRLLFGERLSRVQRIGVATTLIGVGALALANA